MDLNARGWGIGKGEGDGEQANGLNKREIRLSGLFFLILFCSVCSRSNPPSPLPVFLSAVALSFIKKKGRQKLEAVNKHFCETRVDNITQSAFFVLQKLFVPSSTDFCSFSLLEEKNCTKRETGKGARKPFVPSDEPEHSSDNVLGNSFLPPSRSPRIAESPGRIILSHPAICPNTKSVSCKHLSPPSSQLCYRRACERELGRSKKAFPLRGRWI